MVTLQKSEKCKNHSTLIEWKITLITSENHSKASKNHSKKSENHSKSEAHWGNKPSSLVTLEIAPAIVRK